MHAHLARWPSKRCVVRLSRDFAVPLPLRDTLTTARMHAASCSEQYLRSLDSGDVLTEAEKNAVVAKKIGLSLPEITEFNKPLDESTQAQQYTIPGLKK